MWDPVRRIWGSLPAAGTALVLTNILVFGGIVGGETLKETCSVER
jgi:hypothetical protein